MQKVQQNETLNSAQKFFITHDKFIFHTQIYNTTLVSLCVYTDHVQKLQFFFTPACSYLFIMHEVSFSHFMWH
jgi:hypothetical protein